MTACHIICNGIKIAYCVVY